MAGLLWRSRHPTRCAELTELCGPRWLSLCGGRGLCLVLWREEGQEPEESEVAQPGRVPIDQGEQAERAEHGPEREPPRPRPALCQILHDVLRSTAAPGYLLG